MNKHLITQMEEQIKRLGCDCSNLGSSDSIVVSQEGDRLFLSDDHASVEINGELVLQALILLPDNAGYDRFWEAIC